MDTLKKLEILGTSAQDDRSTPTEWGEARVSDPDHSKQRTFSALGSS